MKPVMLAIAEVDRLRGSLRGARRAHDAVRIDDGELNDDLAHDVVTRHQQVIVDRTEAGLDEATEIE